MNMKVGRNNLFYSDEEYDYETEMLSDYLEYDTNQTVVLYEVDYVKTNVNDVYKETERNTDIRYKPPKEIPCLYEIKNSQNKSYDSKTSNAVYMISGNVTLYVLSSTLEKYHCDIKRGDYIGIQIDEKKMYYFTVINDGKINNYNSLFVGAYKSPWRVVECAPVTDDEFTGK